MRMCRLKSTSFRANIINIETLMYLFKNKKTAGFVYAVIVIETTRIKISIEILRNY